MTSFFMNKPPRFSFRPAPRAPAALFSRHARQFKSPSNPIRTCVFSLTRQAAQPSRINAFFLQADRRPIAMNRVSTGRRSFGIFGTFAFLSVLIGAPCPARLGNVSFLSEITGPRAGDHQQRHRLSEGDIFDTSVIRFLPSPLINEAYYLFAHDQDRAFRVTHDRSGARAQKISRHSWPI